MEPAESGETRESCNQRLGTHQHLRCPELTRLEPNNSVRNLNTEPCGTIRAPGRSHNMNLFRVVLGCLSIKYYCIMARAVLLLISSEATTRNCYKCHKICWGKKCIQITFQKVGKAAGFSKLDTSLYCSQNCFMEPGGRKRTSWDSYSSSELKRSGFISTPRRFVWTFFFFGGGWALGGKSAGASSMFLCNSIS